MPKLHNPNSPKIAAEGIIRRWIDAGSPGRCPDGGSNIGAITTWLKAKAAAFEAAGDVEQARFWRTVAAVWPPLAARIRPERELPSRARY